MRYFIVGFMSKERMTWVYGYIFVKQKSVLTIDEIYKEFEAKDVPDAQMISYSEITEEHYNALKTD